MSFIENRVEQEPRLEAYGIAGVVDTWHVGEGAHLLFGGYYRRDVDTGQLEGELVDHVGRAHIKGTQTENYLNFVKIYHDGFSRGEAIITYTYERDMDGGWAGSFVFKDRLGTETGRTTCQTMLLPTKANFLVHTPFNEELFNQIQRRIQDSSDNAHI